MKRLVVEWSGPAVEGNAVSVLHFDDVYGTAASQTKASFDAAKSLFSSNLTITVPSGGDVIDETNGELIDVWNEPGGGGTIVGTSATNQAAGVGACITWLTNGIVNGRRVRGRTFMVPLYSNLYEADGTLSSGAVTLLQAFGASFLTGGLGVWHRPTTTGSTDGSFHDVINYRLGDRVAFLSSRRD